ncbi:MAG: lipoate--protein ligase [Bacteroidales bacterium]|nr:lipoate--protein ligase [Bacteroidales bacterium]
MLCLDLKSTDPFFNLSVEEHFFKNGREEYLILFINSPSAIIGKHQIAHRETDTGYVTENNIPVVRRISGGGAVYHDEGNINYSFIAHSEQGRQINFPEYTLPVIEFLANLGVNARLEGKNNLMVDSFKISGNAGHVKGERVLHHGTLLFDSHLNVLKDVLGKDTSAYTTKAVESIPSPVMNLKNIISGITDSIQFKRKMLEFFLSGTSENAEVGLLPGELKKILALAESKYRTWEWNYAYGPEYHFNRSFEINGKPHVCRLYVKEGIITECRIEGSREMESAARKFSGCRHMPVAIKEILQKENLYMSDQEIYRFF